MNPTPKVMLLIDADNVSSDVIEQAVQRTLAEHGAIHVRRAYSNVEMAVLEIDGSISVVPVGETAKRGRKTYKLMRHL